MDVRLELVELCAHIISQYSLTKQDFESIDVIQQKEGIIEDAPFYQCLSMRLLGLYVDFERLFKGFTKFLQKDHAKPLEEILFTLKPYHKFTFEFFDFIHTLRNYSKEHFVDYRARFYPKVFKQMKDSIVSWEQEELTTLTQSIIREGEKQHADTHPKSASDFLDSLINHREESSLFQDSTFSVSGITGNMDGGNATTNHQQLAVDDFLKKISNDVAPKQKESNNDTNAFKQINKEQEPEQQSKPADKGHTDQQKPKKESTTTSSSKASRWDEEPRSTVDSSNNPTPSSPKEASKDTPNHKTTTSTTLNSRDSSPIFSPELMALFDPEKRKSRAERFSVTPDVPNKSSSSSANLTPPQNAAPTVVTFTMETTPEYQKWKEIPPRGIDKSLTIKADLSEILDPTKKQSRAERFGTVSSIKSRHDKELFAPDKKRQRTDRFGSSLQVTAPQSSKRTSLDDKFVVESRSQPRLSSNHKQEASPPKAKETFPVWDIEHLDDPNELSDEDIERIIEDEVYEEEYQGGSDDSVETLNFLNDPERRLTTRDLVNWIDPETILRQLQKLQKLEKYQEDFFKSSLRGNSLLKPRGRGRGQPRGRPREVPRSVSVIPPQISPQSFPPPNFLISSKAPPPPRRRRP